ncbi:MAG: helix-turn-helix transcriptional regulator [Sandaracinus sp.]|jgi:DNA-binding CsgD family transcriptional regulator|nr:helix-turn-helix transcriptional regulator [Sandaracinus sp.]
MNGTPYVWGAFLHHPLRLADAAALPGLVAQLPFDLEDLARPGYRVAWRDAAVVWGRLRDHLGEDGFAELVGHHVASFPLYTTLATTLSRPTTTYRVLLSILTVVTPVELSRLELVASTLSAELRLPGAATPSRAFFEALGATVRALPTLYGRSEALVRSEYDDMSGRYDAELGDVEIRRGSPTREAATSLLEALGTFDRVTRGAILAQILDLLDEPERRSSTLLLQERLALTRTEARVASRLADGRPVGHIAVELGMAEATVRTHLRNIFRKTGASRQAELVALVHRTLGTGG